MTAVDLLVELASLQTAFLTLDEAIKTTNRRVNALEHVVKPRLENTIAYIKVGPSARRCPHLAGVAPLGQLLFRLTRATCAQGLEVTWADSCPKAAAAPRGRNPALLSAVLQAGCCRRGPASAAAAAAHAQAFPPSPQCPGGFIRARLSPLSLHSLQGELDELEREEFFRLKKVQSNKKKHAEAADALEAARAGAKGGAPAARAGTRENEAANVLAAELQDADIIF